MTQIGFPELFLVGYALLHKIQTEESTKNYTPQTTIIKTQPMIPFLFPIDLKLKIEKDSGLIKKLNN